MVFGLKKALDFFKRLNYIFFEKFFLFLEDGRKKDLSGKLEEILGKSNIKVNYDVEEVCWNFLKRIYFTNFISKICYFSSLVKDESLVEYDKKKQLKKGF